MGLTLYTNSKMIFEYPLSDDKLKPYPLPSVTEKKHS